MHIPAFVCVAEGPLCTFTHGTADSMLKSESLSRCGGKGGKRLMICVCRLCWRSASHGMEGKPLFRDSGASLAWQMHGRRLLVIFLLLSLEFVVYIFLLGIWRRLEKLRQENK